MYTPGEDLTPPARIAIVGAAVVIILAGIRVATPILGPFLIAIFFAMITAPVMAWLTRRRVPPALAAGVVVTGLISILTGAALFLGAAFTGFIRTLPRYLKALEEQAGALTGYGIDPASIRIWDYIDQETAIREAAGIAREAGTIAFDAFLVAMAIVFLLLEAPRLAARLRRHLGAGSPLYQHFSQSSQVLIEYTIVRTKVNLITGAGIAIFLYIFGIEFAALWGFVAFVLSYIPYIGLTIAAIPPTLIALAEKGLVGAVTIIIAITIINTIVENLIFPRIASQGLNLSPFIILFSVVFWALILGAVGVFLAIPLTIAVKLFLESWEETRWIGELMDAKDQEGRPR
jgi:AI-2 transport protein TqsA